MYTFSIWPETWSGQLFTCNSKLVQNTVNTVEYVSRRGNSFKLCSLQNRIPIKHCLYSWVPINQTLQSICKVHNQTVGNMRTCNGDTLVWFDGIALVGMCCAYVNVICAWILFTINCEEKQQNIQQTCYFHVLRIVLCEVVIQYTSIALSRPIALYHNLSKNDTAKTQEVAVRKRKQNKQHRKIENMRTS